MSSNLTIDTGWGGIVFERPRRLGPGVEVFNANDVPITPCGFFIQPEEFPSKLSIESSNGDFQSSWSMPPSWDSFESREETSSGSQTPFPNNSLDFFGRRSFAYSRKVSHHHHHLRRILLVGSPGILCTHVVARLLKNGHHVRLLEREYHSKSAIRGLTKLVETRPSRLSLFYEDDTSFAVADCDGVVYIGGPDTSDALDETEIQERFLASVEDLFLSIRSDGKNVRRVIMIMPASAVFPVETTLVTKSRRVQHAQALALREAERLSKRADVPLTVLLPTMVVGPSLLGECDGNVEALAGFAKRTGHFTTPFYYNIVDVRDVAEASVVALVSPVAEHQKYILSGGEVSLKQIACKIREFIPLCSPPTRELPPFLTSLILQLGVSKLFGLLPCERGLAKQVGWSYALSSLKVQCDLGLQLREASLVVVTAVASALNVPTTTFPVHGNRVCAPPDEERCGKKLCRWWRPYALLTLCGVFGVLGYGGGILFHKQGICTIKEGGLREKRKNRFMW